MVWPHSITCALLFCSLWLPTVAGAGEPPPAGTNKVLVDAWSCARERKTVTTSNRVTASFTVKNVSEQALDAVKVELTFLSGVGEKVAGPLAQTLGALRPQQAVPVQLAGSMVPVFGAYDIVVSYRGGREAWYGNSETAKPEPRAVELAPDTAQVVVLGEEAAVNRAGQLAGKIRVRNEGALEARGVKLTVTFYAVNKTRQKVKLSEWTGPLGDGRVPAGQELTVPFAVPGRAPAGMQGYELKVAADEAALDKPAAGDNFTGAATVEVARWQFRRVGAKQEDLEVACQARNGLAQPVQSVRLTVTFFAAEKGARTTVKTHVQEVPGPLAPGGVTRVSFTLAKMPKYDGYEQAIEYAGAAPVRAAEKPTAGAESKAAVTVVFNEFRALDDGVVMVSCVARNGRPAQIKDVEVTLRFLKADGGELCQAAKKLSEPILPGEERRFVMRAPGAKGYARCESEVHFLELQPAAPPVPDTAAGDVNKGDPGGPQGGAEPPPKVAEPETPKDAARAPMELP